MDKRNKYRLMSRKALEAKYEMELKEEMNEGILWGRFDHFVRIDGKKDAVRLTIDVQLIGEDALVLAGVYILTHSQKLGQRRIEKVEEVLREQLWEDETLFLPLETDERIAFGRHSLRINGRLRDERLGFWVKKTDSTAFELLAVEKGILRDGYGEREEEFHYFYDSKTAWLLTRMVGNRFESNYPRDWQDAFQHCFNHDREAATPYKVLDQQGQFYDVHLVDDPTNIRLFTIDGLKGLVGIQGTKEKSYEKFFTYREASEQANLRTNDKESAWPAAQAVPFTAKKFEIVSDRVIGEEMTVLPVGQWVETAEGLARISSKPLGVYYHVVYEGNLHSTKDRYLHNELVPVENPAIEWTTKQLVGFRTSYEKNLGFGHIVGETPNFYKVKPLSKVIKNVSDHYLNHSFGKRGHFVGREQLLTNDDGTLAALHGTELDFFYIDKPLVEFLEPGLLEQVTQHFEKVDITETEQLINILLKTADINPATRDYLIFYLLLMAETSTLVEVLDEASDVFLQKGVFDTYKEIYNWIQEKTGQNQVSKTSL